MKKKSIVTWVFIAMFACLSVGCLLFWLKDNRMVAYSIFSGILAWMLYKDRED